MVTVVVFVDETTLDNGATVIIPGSHVALGTSYQEGVLAPGAVPPAVEHQTVQIPMAAGGVLLLDSATIHAIGVNHTAAPRMSLTLGYHAVDRRASVDDPGHVVVRGSRPEPRMRPNPFTPFIPPRIEGAAAAAAGAAAAVGSGRWK
eukprot:COSAG04_NODE_11491_length_703_cov_0.988468_1_plen_146_part_10